MALSEQQKKGGRYTKKEQEGRRLQVYQLYFVEKVSAVQIAKDLGVNRNTVNADINFWHIQFVNKSGIVDVESKLVQQIQKMELQRERFLEYLEEANNIDEKIKLEKQISEIDIKLGQFYTKALSKRKQTTSPKELEIIKEDEIEEFVRDVIFGDEEYGLESYYSETKLKLRYLFHSQTDVKSAEKFIQRMKNLGLDLCMESIVSDKEKNKLEHSTDYDLIMFAAQRGYITPEEQTRLLKRQEQIKKLKNMKNYGY